MLFFSLYTYAQKKPLDHSVYDSWQNIGSKIISDNGQWVTYTITPQEGDATLIVYNSKTQLAIPRGYNPVISKDNQYIVFSIKPPFAVTRQAKIKKKKASEMPKDSLGIITLSSEGLWKTGAVRSFKTPEKGSGVMAYLQEKPQYDSTSGTLVIMYPNIADTVKDVQEYAFSKPGNKLLIATKTGVLLWDVATHKADTVSRGIGTRKQFAFDEEGKQAAWYSSTRDSIRQLYYYAQDTGKIIVEKDVSPDGKVWFSRNGERLFLGTAPTPAPKDTNIVDFEVAKVDIWNYKDDYLQPMQLKNTDKELKRNYLAVYYPAKNKLIQLADKDMENVLPADEGNSNYALGYTDKGDRVAMQWTGHTLKTSWLINLNDGTRKLVKEHLDSTSTISPDGKYILWYDVQKKHWFTYENATGITRNISALIPTAMYEEDDDHPDAPGPYGVAVWEAKDQFVYIYDRYDIWKIDPTSKQPPVAITEGRKDRLRFRYISLDKEERYIVPGQQLLLETFNDVTKENGLYLNKKKIMMGPFTINTPVKAKNADIYIYTKGSYLLSPDVYLNNNFKKEIQLSHINPQQQQYNWGTAELFKWTAYNGKQAEGILYKPEDFDSTKKYPVILYFYEKLTEDMYAYIPPAPTPSRLNISFFVSRGYIVLAPDITYENGHPGKSAYNYIVSGARALAKNTWADSLHMGIQGQSWGGYQVAYLVTQTNLFKAAWAGAPVANMTSAYGGIRWETGMNRQFQYERSQSRIGATLWDKPELYIENSPLFHLPNVNTPVAIMSNDADGAVPWYQGIELFTGLRRLGKPVWLLNYNNEAHNLVLRQNRKDIQRREQQFFDHFLKDAPAPEWMETGVPATEKGKNWGW
jgi:dipeptidyl aminopeptidase/acylaminoacyl peptidase